MRIEGVGKKTAERLTFNMLAYWDEKAFHEFCELLRTIKSKLHRCEKCGSLVEEDRCPYCTEDRMSGGTLCVVAHPKDAYILESTNAYKGGYFVLGTLLSPLDGRGISQEVSDKLLYLIEQYAIQEVVLALDSSLEGEATAYYVRELVSSKNLTVTKLASGIPMGTQLDLVDRGTLSEAFRCRQTFS